MTHRLGRLLLLAIFVFGASSPSSLGQDAGVDHEPDAEHLVRQLSDRCRVWLSQPGTELKSLKYTFHLGGDEQVVELAPAAGPVRRSMWQGATLHTGLHALAASPENFQATAEAIQGDPTYAEPFIRLTVRPKASDQSFHLEVGNGIEGSWHGFYTHNSPEMLIDLNPKTLLPIRELHQGSQYTFGEWREVKREAWVPQLVVATRGDSDYRMHFAWQGGTVWLLTHAEVVRGGQTRPISRVSDVLVNDATVAVALSAEQQRLEAARQIVRSMLDRNVVWLSPRPSFDSLQYTFHIERQDVTESCAVRRDGFTVFEVSGDGQGKMADSMGNRRIVTPGNRYASASRGDALAKIREVTPERNEPNYALQLRRYALSGCQFDLPLFELRRVLDDARIEVKDGEWNGTPCHVATVTMPGRWGYLGCGVMLGFTSWSYVHHLYPDYEVIYIDKERLVPMHETFVSSRDDRRFEIDFGEYRRVDGAGEQLVPMRIEIAAEEYFTCRYEFQLLDAQHWLLRTVESWFDPAEKSRGVVENVRIDEPSDLADEAERQVEAYRELFEADASANSISATTPVDTLPFQLGQPLTVGPVNVVFTLDEKDHLVARCIASAGDVEVGQSVTVLLLDDKNALLQAGHVQFVAENGQLRAEKSFGKSYALRNVSRFVIVGLGGASTVAGAERRQLRVLPITLGAEPLRTRGIADESGKTQMVDVTLRQIGPSQSVVVIHFISSDSPQEFQFDLSAAAFDKSGRLVAAASRPGVLRVEDDIRDEKWELALPSSVDPREISAVAVGITRGHTLSAPFSVTWMTYLDLPGPFSLETCLAAADPNCWPAALEQLNRELQETLQHGLLGSAYDWQEQQNEHETPVDQLRPHVARLLEIVDLAPEAATRAEAFRLLGFSADLRAIELARELLRSDDSTVRDAAAVALGLLKSDEGLARIDELIGRPEPDREDPAWRAGYQARRDAVVALATIRSDASIPIVEKWMEKFVDETEVIVQERGGYQLGGSAHLLQQFAQLLGRLPDARYLPILTAALARVEQRDLAIVPHREELLESIISYGPAAREVIEPRVRRGDWATIYAIRECGDDSYIDAVGTMLETSTDRDSWRPAIDYLWNRDSEDALKILRETFDRGVTEVKGQEATRLYLAKALAHRGDARGLPAALAILVELAEPGDPPQDEQSRRDWQKNIDDRREDALEVFERAAANDMVTLLAERSEHADVATRLAILQVLEQMYTIPTALRPDVEQWARDMSNSKVSQLAERMLVRQR
jgi:hypothetical protein